MIQEAASLWIRIKKYEEILGRDPKALSFAPLADLYRQAGLLDDALATARFGVALYPDFAAGQMALARIYLDRSMEQEAKAALESVVRVTPENIEAQRLLAGFYNDAGNFAAASVCLGIINALEPDSTDNLSSVEPVADDSYRLAPSTATAEEISLQSFDLSVGTGELDEEELMDADILELTDELFEEESSVSASLCPFAASPARPSLSEPSVAPEPVTDMAEDFSPTEDFSPSSPVASVTIAELYITQGFKDKGIDVYRELLLADPGNLSYRNRFDELIDSGESSPLFETGRAEPAEKIVATVPVDTSLSHGVVDTLQSWLTNIRRVKECRLEHP